VARPISSTISLASSFSSKRETPAFKLARVCVVMLSERSADGQRPMRCNEAHRPLTRQIEEMALVEIHQTVHLGVDAQVHLGLFRDERAPASAAALQIFRQA